MTIIAVSIIVAILLCFSFYRVLRNRSIGSVRAGLLGFFFGVETIIPVVIMVLAYWKFQLEPKTTLNAISFLKVAVLMYLIVFLPACFWAMDYLRKNNSKELKYFRYALLLPLAYCLFMLIGAPQFLWVNSTLVFGYDCLFLFILLSVATLVVLFVTFFNFSSN